jgi:hypothetical protein
MTSFLESYKGKRVGIILSSNGGCSCNEGKDSETLLDMTGTLDDFNETEILFTEDETVGPIIIHRHAIECVVPMVDEDEDFTVQPNEE